MPTVSHFYSHYTIVNIIATVCDNWNINLQTCGILPLLHVGYSCSSTLFAITDGVSAYF